MLEVRKFYSEILYRGFHESMGYMEIRTINNLTGRVTSEFFQKFEDLLEYIHGAENVYHGMMIRSDKKRTKEYSVYANTLAVDIDFHTPDMMSRMEEYKTLAISEMSKNCMMSQAAAVIDSGRGLHFYYLLPRQITTDIYKRYCNTFKKYVSEFHPVLSKHADMSIYDPARIMRCPGSVNKKYKGEGFNADVTVLSCDPGNIVDKDFVAMLKRDTVAEHADISVLRAMELLDMEPSENGNINCPFPDHEDTHASFRYYPETDSYWCFKCRNGSNGLDFLTAMGRNDKIAQLKAEHDVSLVDSYRLAGDGRMFKMIGKADKFCCDFKSSVKIESSSDVYGRRTFIDLATSAIEITDIPGVKELMRRYSQEGFGTFISDIGESSFPQALARFIDKSSTSDKIVVCGNGMNDANGENLYYLNKTVYPKSRPEAIYVGESIGLKQEIEIEDDYNINSFIENLIGDGNHTHTIALVWGIACLARDIIVNRSGIFPMLVATGIRESGKTLLGKMVCSMFGYDHSEELDTTPFAMIKKIERYGTMPLHFDEYSSKWREKEHDEILKDMATNQFVIRERGNAAQKLNRFILQAPVIITGEKNIIDAGLVSRSIIFNVGKNIHGSTSYFNNWMTDVRYFRLMSFVHKVLLNWDKLRDHVDAMPLRRNRDEMKEDIIFGVLDYLEDNNLVNKGLIRRDIIKDILEENMAYKKVISPDNYTEILNECLSAEFNENENVDNCYSVKLMMDSFFFSTTHNIVIVNISSMFNLYKLYCKDGYGKIKSVKEFKLSLVQSPDSIGTMGRKRIYQTLPSGGQRERRFNDPVAIRVSETNYSFLMLPMLHKLVGMGSSVEDAYNMAGIALKGMSEGTPVLGNGLQMF